MRHATGVGNINGALEMRYRFLQQGDGFPPMRSLAGNPNHRFVGIRGCLVRESSDFFNVARLSVDDSVLNRQNCHTDGSHGVVGSWRGGVHKSGRKHDC